MNKSIDQALAEYESNGYVVLNVFSASEYKIIKSFAEKWVKSVIKSGGGGNPEIDKAPLQDYHRWWKQLGVVHDGLFAAKNRYIDPPDNLKAVLINNRISEFVKKLTKDTNLWADPGLGWFGFRMIRPGHGDGYPTSCKNWGAAAGVISVWLPIIGFSDNETLALVKGSHKKEYAKYLPEGSKFTAGEFRLAPSEDKMIYTRPSLKEGEIILYHPGTLHTEDVFDSKITRINLEYRFKA